MKLVRVVLIGACLLGLAQTAQAQFAIPSGSSVVIPSGGSLDLACVDLSIQGSLVVGDGQVQQADSVGIGAGGVLDGGAGSITLSGDWNNVGTFIPGTSTVVLTDGCGPATSQLLGTTVFHNLTLSSSTGHTFVIPAGSNITVTGTLTLQGSSGTPIQLASSGPGTAIINLGPGAQVVSSFAVVPPTVQIGAQAVAGPASIPAVGAPGLVALGLLLSALAARFGRFPTARTPSLRDLRDGK